MLSFTNSFSLLICNINKWPKVWKTIPFLIFTYNSISLFVQYSILDELLPNIKSLHYNITSECWFCAPWLWKNDYRICSRRFLLSVALQVKVRKKCNIRLNSELSRFIEVFFLNIDLNFLARILHNYGSYIFTKLN